MYYIINLSDTCIINCDMLKCDTCIIYHYIDFSDMSIINCDILTFDTCIIYYDINLSDTCIIYWDKLKCDSCFSLCVLYLVNMGIHLIRVSLVRLLESYVVWGSSSHVSCEAPQFMCRVRLSSHVSCEALESCVVMSVLICQWIYMKGEHLTCRFHNSIQFFGSWCSSTFQQSLPVIWIKTPH